MKISTAVPSVRTSADSAGSPRPAENSHTHSRHSFVRRIIRRLCEKPISQEPQRGSCSRFVRQVIRQQQRWETHGQHKKLKRSLATVTFTNSTRRNAPGRPSKPFGASLQPRSSGLQAYGRHWQFHTSTSLCCRRFKGLLDRRRGKEGMRSSESVPPETIW